MKPKTIPHEVGAVVTCLTIISQANKNYESKIKIGYIVKHNVKSFDGQGNEPCGEEFEYTHYQLTKRVTAGAGRFCPKCSPRGPKGKNNRNTTRQVGDVAKDRALKEVEFSLMDQMAVPMQFKYKIAR